MVELENYKNKGILNVLRIFNPMERERMEIWEAICICRKIPELQFIFGKTLL